MPSKPDIKTVAAGLRHRAEAPVRDRRKGRWTNAGHRKSGADPARVLQELEVHQIELELQNAELQKARNDLEVALDKYTDLYDFSPSGYVSVDESGVILEANLTSAVLLGVERSRLVSRRLPLLVSSPDRPGFLSFLKKVFTGPRNCTCEAQLLRANGATFWAGFRATSAVSLDGTVRWCRVTFADISERKEAEEALRVSEERFRALFELGPVAVYACDASGVIQEFNRHAAKLWGREPTPGDAKQRFCGSFKLLRPDGSVMPHARCPMAEVVSGKIPAAHDVDVLVERPDGSRISVIVNIRPLKNQREEITGAINCFYDITDRKHAEELLRQNEALFSALVAQSPVGVYVVDARLRLQQVNPKALPVFKNIQPLIGRKFSEVIQVLWPKTVADHVIALFRHTLETGEPYQTLDFGERRRDIGSMEFYEWQIQRVTLPTGEHGVVCFFTNITERKRAEAAQRRLDILSASNRKLRLEIIRRQAVERSLKKSQQHQTLLLEQSRRMQEQLRQLSRQVLHGQEEERKRISRELHDVIAQSLTGINLRLATLKKGASLNIKGLERNITRTQELVRKSVETVHRFARELRPAVLDDLGLIPALHAFMKSFTEETSIRVSFLAYAAVEQVTNEKRTVLYRVAQEALTNVARHSQASQVEVKIHKRDDAICMKIKDNGKGFQQAGAAHAKRNKRLGLLGMRERLDMVGGHVTLTFAPGKGTTVLVKIPLIHPRRQAVEEAR